MSMGPLSVKVQWDNIEQFNSQAKRMSDTVKTAGDQIAQAGTKIGGLQTPFSGAQTGMQKFSQEALQTQQSTYRLTGGINDMSKTLPGVNTGLSKSGTAMEQLGTSANNAQTGTKKFGTAITGLAGIMTQGVGAGIQLFNMYDSIGDAQVQVTNKSNRLSKAQEAEGKARDKLNSLMKSGTATTQEIAAAQLDLEQATKAVAVKENDLENAQETLNQTMAEFAKNILPLIIQTVGGTISSITLLKGSFLGAGTAGVKGSEGVSFFGKAVGKLPALMGPIGIVLAGVGAAMALIGTNAFGVRDALDGLGKAIGEMFPILKPVLEGIRSFGEMMGLTSVDVSEYTGNVTKAVKPTEDLGTAWKKMVEEMKKDPGPGMKTLATNLDDTGRAMKDFTTVTTTEPQRWLGEVNKFFDQISKGDYSAAVDTLFSNLQKTFEGNVKGFEATGKLIANAIKTGIFSLGKAYVDHHLWIGEQMRKGLPHILGIGQEIASRLNEGIGQGLAAFGALIDQTILQPLRDIPKNVTDIGQQLYEKSGLKWFIDTVTAGLNTVKGALGLGGVAGGTATAPPIAPQTPAAPPTGFSQQDPRLLRPSSFVGDTYAQGFGPQFMPQQVAIPGGAKGPTQVSPGIGSLLSKPGAAKKEGGVEPDFLTKGTLALEAQKKQLEENLGVLLSWGIQNGVQIPKGIQNNAEAMTGYLETLKSKDDADKKNMGTMLAKNMIEKDATQAIKNKAQSEIEALTATASNYVGYGNALKLTAAQQQAVIDEFQPLNEGMKEENANLLAVQTGYATMSKGRLNNILNLQKERQGLELNNLLTADSNRLQVAQAQAMTEGVRKGVEFANNLMTQNAEMEGYRTALTAAIGRSKEWADSLGLTNHQLELQLSKTSDIKAAQEGIINSLADQVHGLEVNKAAWETLSEAEKQNISHLQDLREHYISLQQPLANTFENLTKLRTSYLDGAQSGKDFLMSMREQAEEMAGFRAGILDTANDTPALSSALKELGGTSNLTNDELSQLVGVIMGAPDAIQKLAGEMEGLSDELLGMVDFGEKAADKLMPDEASLKNIPKDIRNIMSGELQKGLIDEAAIQRAAGMIGPAINFAAGQSLRSGDLSFISDFASGVAGKLEDEFNGQIPPAMNTLMNLLSNPPSNPDQLMPWIQRVNTELQKVKDPLANAAVDFNSLGKNAAGATGGINQVTSSLNPLNEGIQAAGASLVQFQTYLTENKPAISVDITQGTTQLQILQSQANGIKQMKVPSITVNISSATTLLQRAQSQINGLKQTKIPKLTVNISGVINGVNQAQNKINSLKGKSVTNTVTTVHRSIAAAKGFTGVVSAPTNFTVGEGNKPEFVQVTPLSDSGSAIRGTNTTNNITSKIPSALSGGRNNRGSESGGSGRSGDTTIVVPVHIGNEKIETVVKRVAGRRRDQMFR